MTTAEAIDWAELPFFLAVSRSGSLRAAAQSLAATHATVNRRIRALEQGYGVQLFERSVEGLRLTEAGKALLPLALEAEQSVVAARRKLAGLDAEAAGKVRVSVPPALAASVLGPMFSDFMRQHTDIELEIISTNRHQDLTRHEIDVSVRVGFSVTDDVVGRRVLQYTKGLYASRDYVDTVLPAAGPGGEGMTWLGWGETAGIPDWVRKSPFPKAKVRHILRESDLIAALVSGGAGISYLPTYVEHFYPNLVQIPGTKPTLDRSIWLLLHSDLRRTKRVRLLVDFLADQLLAAKDMLVVPIA